MEFILAFHFFHMTLQNLTGNFTKDSFPCICLFLNILSSSNQGEKLFFLAYQTTKFPHSEAVKRERTWRHLILVAQSQETILSTLLHGYQSMAKICFIQSSLILDLPKNQLLPVSKVHSLHKDQLLSMPKLYALPLYMDGLLYHSQRAEPITLIFKSHLDQLSLDGSVTFTVQTLPVEVSNLINREFHMSFKNYKYILDACVYLLWTELCVLLKFIR